MAFFEVFAGHKNAFGGPHAAPAETPVLKHHIIGTISNSGFIITNLFVSRKLFNKVISSKFLSIAIFLLYNSSMKSLLYSASIFYCGIITSPKIANDVTKFVYKVRVFLQFFPSFFWLPTDMLAYFSFCYLMQATDSYF